MPDRALEGLRVLAVDDQVEARDFISVVLGEYGANVTTVPSCHEALASVTERVPDILIIDIHMPDQDGCLVLGRLRTTHGVATVPALALVASSSESECERVLQSGFQMWLAKPMDAAQLAATVAGMSGRAGAEVAAGALSANHGAC